MYSTLEGLYVFLQLTLVFIPHFPDLLRNILTDHLIVFCSRLMVPMRKELIGLQGVLSLLPILIALVGLFLFCVSGLVTSDKPCF